jgi:hypothetical protein
MRRYRPGPKIHSLNELMEQDCVYWRNKITHKAWFENWQISMAQEAIDGGFIRTAIKISKEDSI